MQVQIDRANFFKRTAAFLLDFILIGILVTGFIFLCMKIASYDKHYDNMMSYYTVYGERYAYQDEDGKTKKVDFAITDEDYKKLPQSEKAHYIEASNALAKDEGFKAERKYVIFTLIISLVISILISVLIIDFLIPLIFKNGQTLGKKVFSLSVIREDGVKASTFQLFVRAIFGKFLIELAIPALMIILIFFNIMGIVGTVAVILIYLIDFIMFVGSYYKTPIHDKISFSVVVDMKTQMIFKTKEEMMNYHSKLHKEEVKKKIY